MTARFMSEPPWGRSPRARGSHAGQRALHIPDGSIPACAGEPRTKPPPPSLRRVDPRVRGGAIARIRALAFARGRSPRARGSLRDRNDRGSARGSIPACAGEPWTRWTRRPAPPVDPRVRGGASCVRYGRTREYGRSPRARGSQNGGGGQRLTLGSIPACAGEPNCSAEGSRDTRVDPRVRGGASLMEVRRECLPGRSPRARGSRPAGVG